eukprot:PhF_6_TR39633/c0_g1_i1/m.58730/K07962/ARL13B, ARL2L1; ADP-ribosylation factor-like protein 13B
MAIQNPVDPRIDAGVEWLLGAVALHYQNLAMRVKQQKEIAKAQQDQKRAEQGKRVREHKRADYIQKKELHFFFEHLAGRVLVETPKDILKFLREELERSVAGKKLVTFTLFGLDGAGKTSMVHAIGGEPNPNTAPTMGFVPHKMSQKCYDVNVFDLGGRSNFRGIWTNYYADTHGILFVVDSADKDRINEAKEALKGILDDPRCHSKPLVIFANKHDQPGAMSGELVLSKLGLARGPMVEVVECCAIADPADERVDKGIEWALDTVANSYSQISLKVLQHLAKDKEAKLIRLAQQKARVVPDAPKVTITGEEASIAYIKSTGVHYVLEELAAKVLAEQPDDFVSFMLQDVVKQCETREKEEGLKK